MNILETDTIEDSIICHCFKVTASRISGIMDSGHSDPAGEIERRTCAGTGCGACRCRIQRIVQGRPIQCWTCNYCENCGVLEKFCSCMK